MTATTSLKACVIDDDNVYVFGMKKLLQLGNLSNNIVEFYSGLEAITYFRDTTNHEELPDVIFLDINMPGMNGWEFLDAYSALSFKKNIPIYMVSSSINEEDKMRARSFDVIKEYITKPVTLAELKEIFSMQSPN
ncbi:MAG: response regulator [Chitinophagaceae bacterium]|nr:response regulator [Chitinophagaceae bacterium]